MENIKNSQSFDLNFVLRWTARISGALLFVFWALLLAKEGFGKFTFSSNSENILITCQIITFLGLGLIWFNELLGGILSILGMLAFYLINFLASNELPAAALLLLFYIPGILALISWRMKRKAVS